MSSTQARASTGARVAAWALAVGLAALAAVQLYWALGGSWGVHAASGGAYEDATTELRVSSAVVVVVLAAAIAIVLGRVGVWGAGVRFGVFRWGAWAVAIALVLGAAVNIQASTSWERYGNGGIAVVLALLALVVARSGAPPRERHRAAPTPA